LALVALFSVLTLGKKVTHTFDKNVNWMYVDKFCFSESGGNLQFDYTAPRVHEYLQQRIVVYSTAEWSNVYKQTGMDCKERVKEGSAGNARWSKTFQQLQTEGGCKHVQNSSTVSCSIPVGYTQPAYFYVAVANCPFAGPGGVPNMSYVGNRLLGTLVLNMTNSGTPVYATLEFGVDEHTIYETTIVFHIWYFCLLLACYYIKTKCKAAGLQYKIIKWVGAASFFSWFGTIFKLVYLGEYSNNGTADGNVDGFANLLQLISDMLLLVTVVDLARGYTISTNSVPRRVTFCVVLLVFILGCILYTAGRWRDPALTEYVYESTPGYLLIVTRLLVTVWVGRILHETYNEEKEHKKRQWYQTFGVFSIMWLLSVPITAAIGMSLPIWALKRSVYGTEHAFAALSYTLVALMFSPFDWVPFNVVLSPEEVRVWGANQQIFPAAALDDSAQSFDQIRRQQEEEEDEEAQLTGKTSMRSQALQQAGQFKKKKWGAKKAPTVGVHAKKKQWSDDEDAQEDDRETGNTRGRDKKPAKKLGKDDISMSDGEDDSAEIEH